MKIIKKVEDGYDNIYDIDLIKFTVYYKTLPKLVIDTENATIDQLKAEISTINAKPTYIQLKEELAKSQKALEAAELVGKELGTMISVLSQSEKDIIDKALKTIPELLISYGAFEDIDMDYLIEATKIEHQNKIQLEELKESIKLSLANVVTKAL